MFRFWISFAIRQGPRAWGWREGRGPACRSDALYRELTPEASESESKQFFSCVPSRHLALENKERNRAKSLVTLRTVSWPFSGIKSTSVCCFPGLPLAPLMPPNFVDWLEEHSRKRNAPLIALEKIGSVSLFQIWVEFKPKAVIHPRKSRFPSPNRKGLPKRGGGWVSVEKAKAGEAFCARPLIASTILPITWHGKVSFREFKEPVHVYLQIINYRTESNPDYWLQNLGSFYIAGLPRYFRCKDWISTTMFVITTLPSPPHTYLLPPMLLYLDVLLSA